MKAVKTDPKFCKKLVTTCEGPLRSYTRQCTRKVKEDGFCKQHHPTAQAKRDSKSKELYDKKIYDQPWAKAGRLEKKLKQAKKTILQAIDLLTPQQSNAFCPDVVKARKVLEEVKA